MKMIPLSKAKEKDPFFDNVTLLAHMDGLNNGTSFVDSSKNALTMTVVDQAKMVDSPSKFKQSAVFPTTPSLINVSDAGSGFDVTSGVFTVEAWVRIDSIGTDVYIWSNRILNGSTNPGIGFTVNLNGYAYTYGGNASGSVGTNYNFITPLTVGVFHHVAVVVSGGLGKSYLDGVLAVTYDVPATYSTQGLSHFGSIYSPQNGNRFPGYVDEFRFTNGIARYTGNFTPPTEPFPNG